MDDIDLKLPDDFSKVDLCGEIISNGVLAYEKDGEKFCDMLVKLEDKYERMTICSVTFSENLLKNEKVSKGERIYLKGRLRSCCDGKNGAKLNLTVLAETLFFDNNRNDECAVTMMGTICKPIIFATTKKGEKIARTVLSIEGKENRSDYIPLITDDYLLEQLQDLKAGDKIFVWGSLKSAQQKEKISDMEMYIKTEVADEVFINHFSKIEL